MTDNQKHEDGYLCFTGYSDDIVSIGGDKTQEYYPPYDDDALYVTNTGSVVKAKYDGTWQFEVIQKGAVDRFTLHGVGNDLTDKQYTQALEIHSENVITNVIQISSTEIKEEP